MAYNSGYWETLEDELRKEIAEARAEIERLRQENVELLVKYDEKFGVIDAKDKLIEQMRAEIAADEARLVAYVARVSGEIERKDKLIAQMREALRLADDLIDEYAADYEHRDNVDEVRDMIKAALSAAERERK